MKNKTTKRLLAAVMAAVLGSLTGCGGGSTGTETQAPSQTAETQNDHSEAAEGTDGSIIWLSQMNAGPQYEAALAYANMICDDFGYSFKVVYGDANNDPAGNLSAVKNAMTNEVKGIVMSQDGGVQNILDEYPELYMVGYSSDMESVYGDGGASAAAASNEKFLGTIADGHIDGSITGKVYADICIGKGFKKIATMTFPAYAYPNMAAAQVAFRSEINKYNDSAADADKIELVGDVKVLEFAPLEETWFLEDGNGEIDAIVSMMAGTDFVYPALKSAMANGSCSADTKLVTGGFSDDPSLLADIGDEGVIAAINISPLENIGWSLIMLDNAITGNMYSDYTVSDRVDSVDYIIDSIADIDQVMSDSLIGTGDAARAQISLEELKNMLTRYNPEATYAELKELFQSAQLKVDALVK